MNLWKYMESFYGNIFIQGLADFYDLRDNQQKKNHLPLIPLFTCKMEMMEHNSEGCSNKRMLCLAQRVTSKLWL